MKAEKKENLINEKINPQANELADLAVTDEQAQQAKGGAILTHEVGHTLGFRHEHTKP